MATDIRLQAGLLTNPKWIRLGHRLGETGQLALIRLWLWTAEHRPDGVLRGLDAGDIELFSGWAGDAGALVSALLDLTLVEASPGGPGGRTFAVHEWSVHNAYVASKRARSEVARQNAVKRWAGRRGSRGRKKQVVESNGNADALHDGCGNDASVDAPPPPPTPTLREEEGGMASPAARPKGAAGSPPRERCCAACGTISSGPSAIRLTEHDGRLLCGSCEPQDAPEPCGGCGRALTHDEAFARRLAESTPVSAGVEHCEVCDGWFVVRGSRSARVEAES